MQRTLEQETDVVAGTQAPGADDATKSARHRARVRHLTTVVAGRFGVLLVLAAIFLVFSVMRPATFATGTNIATMGTTESVAAILALAVLIPLVVGEFDMSVANLLGFAGVLVVKFDSLPLPVDIAIVLAIGALVGLVNGLIVTKLRVNSFIATIGTSTAIGGLSLAFTGGEVLFRGLPTTLFSIGRNSLAGVNLSVIYAIVIALALWYLLNHTPLGRYMYGVGGSRTVARLSGVPVERMTCASFVAAGFLAAVAGVVEIAQIGSADPTFGPSFLLPAFAAVFLGATTVKPGTPNVVGVLIAVTLLTVITDGLGQLGAPDWVEPVFNGVVLVLAVAMAIFVLRVAPGGGVISGERGD